MSDDEYHRREAKRLYESLAARPLDPVTHAPRITVGDDAADALERLKARAEEPEPADKVPGLLGRTLEMDLIIFWTLVTAVFGGLILTWIFWTKG